MINMYNKTQSFLWFWCGLRGAEARPHAERIPARFMQIFSIAIHAFSLGILMGHTNSQTMKSGCGGEVGGGPLGDCKFLRFFRRRHSPFSIFQPNKAAMQRPENWRQEEWALSAWLAAVPTSPMIFCTGKKSFKGMSNWWFTCKGSAWSKVFLGKIWIFNQF